MKITKKKNVWPTIRKLSVHCMSGLRQKAASETLPIPSLITYLAVPISVDYHLPTPNTQETTTLLPALTGQCCDNCTLKAMPPPTSPPHSTNDSIDIAIVKDKPSKYPNIFGKQLMGSASCEGAHRAGEHLHHIHQALFQWCTNTRRQDYPCACFTGIAILSDGPLTTIASNCCLKESSNL